MYGDRHEFTRRQTKITERSDDALQFVVRRRRRLGWSGGRSDLENINSRTHENAVFIVVIRIFIVIIITIVIIIVNIALL